MALALESPSRLIQKSRSSDVKVWMMDSSGGLWCMLIAPHPYFLLGYLLCVHIFFLDKSPQATAHLGLHRQSSDVFNLPEGYPVALDPWIKRIE